MTTVLLIAHALLAVALLGALTHQALAVWWPPRNRRWFVSSFRGVSASAYTNAVIVLFLATALIGGIIYPAYRLGIRIVLEDYRLFAANGSFELKEHFVAIGAGLLPAYWYFWRRATLEQDRRTRAMLTGLLALIVWWSFIVGHILNNIRGFGT